jgi:hypothetical protein
MVPFAGNPADSPLDAANAVENITLFDGLIASISMVVVDKELFPASAITS